MDKKILAIFSIIIIALILSYFFFFQRSREKNTLELDQKGNMTITSPIFKNNEAIPKKYTCDGANVNPPLKISDIPPEAKSLVLIIDDPDAVSGTWAHWIVWNIDPQIDQVEENSVPTGAIEGITDFGSPGYGGPCPPSGTHRYFFRLYALDIKLGLKNDADREKLDTAIEGHILAETAIIGLYKR